jgi:hypothetical protein
MAITMNNLDETRIKYSSVKLQILLQADNKYVIWLFGLDCFCAS